MPRSFPGLELWATLLHRPAIEGLAIPFECGGADSCGEILGFDPSLGLACSSRDEIFPVAAAERAGVCRVASAPSWKCISGVGWRCCDRQQRGGTQQAFQILQAPEWNFHSGELLCAFWICLSAINHEFNVCFKCPVVNLWCLCF